jgi:cytochrome o ubiquinol oxidase subunit II
LKVRAWIDRVTPAPFFGSAMNILDPIGPIGVADKTLLIDSVVIMLVIIVPTIAAIFAFAFWFRQSNPRAVHLPGWAESGRIELVVWSIPTLTIMLLGGVAWIGSHRLDPAVPVEGTGNPVRIQVVSLDWKWLFIYPDQKIATVNTLTVPLGAPLHFELTSGSVMNVFFVPQLGSMIYTMNGMVTQLNLRADREGTYQGLSAMISGDGFSDMIFDVHVVSPLAFPGWAADAARDDHVLNSDSYAKLARQSVETSKISYRLADPELFGKIATQEIAPGPGPELSTTLEKADNGARNAR